MQNNAIEIAKVLSEKKSWLMLLTLPGKISLHLRFSSTATGRFWQTALVHFLTSQKGRQSGTWTENVEGIQGSDDSQTMGYNYKFIYGRD